MDSQTFESVWDVLEENPVKNKNIKLRSQLMQAISKSIEDQQLTQQQAAKILHISQPRVSALLQGKLDAFRLDSLVNIAHQLDWMYPSISLHSGGEAYTSISTSIRD